LRNTSGFLTEISDGKVFRRDAKSAEPSLIPQGLSLGTVSHHITHHSIRAEVFILPWSSVEKKVSSLEKPDWLERSKLGAQLVSSLDIKAWGLLQKVNLQKELFA
jgi:hypothetical protein